MYGRSDRFDQAVRNGDATVICQLEVLDSQGAHVVSIPGEDNSIGLVSGAVTVDITASARRRYTATLADATGEYVPSSLPDDIFSVVSGNEIRLWRGFRYPDGDPAVEAGDAPQVETLSCGIFDIDEPLVDDSDLSIELSGQDRSRAIREHQYVNPYTVKKGVNIISAAQAVITDRRPGTQFRGMTPASTPVTTPYLTYNENTDPTQIVDQILGSAGLEWFFDVDGYVVIQPVPDPTLTEAVWEFAEGETSTLLDLKGGASRDPIYNGVVALGESTYGISPAKATVWDDDPNSPTYYLGAFGPKPKILPANPLIQTRAQAVEAATAELRKSIRVVGTYDFSFVPHPALEGDDVVWLERSRVHLAGRYSVERFTIPLDPTAKAEAKTKERQ